mmetsp:Transcript_28848/g.92105  ORF Transcript_28848/g.92105 Transcript_28848/m.92105 type:complete len:323 (-) Transcript_28848:296-1264(-)
MMKPFPLPHPLNPYKLPPCRSQIPLPLPPSGCSQLSLARGFSGFDVPKRPGRLQRPEKLTHPPVLLGSIPPVHCDPCHRCHIGPHNEVHGVMVARGDHQEGLDYHTCPLQCNENVPEGITPPQEPVAVDRHPHPKGDYRENVAAEHQIAAVLVTGRGLAAENISPADRRLVGLVANLAVLCWPWQRRDHVCEETKRVPQGNEGHQPDGRGDSVLADLVRVRRECWHQEHRQNNHGKVEVHGELVRPLPAGIHLGDPLKPKILKRRQLHMAAECEVAVRALRQIPNHEHNYGRYGPVGHQNCALQLQPLAHIPPISARTDSTP